MTSLFHGVANLNPAALRTRNIAPDKDQAAVGISFENFEVLGGHALSTEVTCHFLAFEDFPGVLALTGRPMRAVRNGDTV